MCGIAGLIGFGPNVRVDESLTDSVFESIRHRGPDGERHLTLPDLGLTLFHSRLAINDLTETGSQPMTSYCGRYVLVFNGEIYNFRELAFRVDLDPEGLSDSRVFLELIANLGVTHALNEAYGMFAFALLDTREKTLTLVRDRFGEKPLYFGTVNIEGNRVFAFSSEMRTFRSISDQELIYTPRAIAEFGKLGFVNKPPFNNLNITRLSPGHLLRLEIEEAQKDTSKQIGPEMLWVEHSSKTDIQNTDVQVFRKKSDIQILEEILFSVIEDCLSADVEVGSFLSGGIDSSLVTAIAAKIRPSAVKSYTVGFCEPDYDESRIAAKWASGLNIDHQLINVDDDRLEESLPKILETIDEPFADSSYIPCYLISEAASKDVKVVLTGDGGDEIFGGYNRHIYTTFIIKTANLLPDYLMKNLLYLAEAANQRNWLGWGFATSTVRPEEKIQKAIRLLHVAAGKDIDEVYAVLLTNPQFISVLSESLTRMDLKMNDNIFAGGTQLPAFRQLMLKDISNYLPNDILYKVDRASMQNGLEVRAPFLDFRVASLAFRLPEDQLIQGRTGKIILRRLLKELAGSDWVDRPKSGFSVPLARVFRTNLRSFVDRRLRCINHRFVDNEKVQNIWRRHLDGSSDCSQSIWQLLVLERFLK